MLTDSVGFGGEYETYRTNLADDQIRKVIYQIFISERFAFGEQSHVVLRGTDKIVGYVGNESLELCCPADENPALYKVPHKHLKRIFRAATNRMFHKCEKLAMRE